LNAGDGRALRLEDRGVKHSNLKTGAPNEREAHQPDAPTHARRHEHAQVRADTQREYIRAVKRLATFLGRSPDTATPEELRAFQLHLTKNGAEPPSINATTWGSAMTHHPHLHMIVPGGGLSMDDSRWISCKPNFLLPVRVLSKLFRRLMLEKLLAAHQATV
jgi:hypothetical protein